MPCKLCKTVERGTTKSSKNFKWLQNTIQGYSSNNKTLSNKCLEIRDTCIGRDVYRNKENDTLPRFTTQHPSVGVSVADVLEKEGKRRISPDIQSEKAQRPRYGSKISPDNSLSDPITSERTGLHDEDRSLSGIFSCAHRRKSSSIPVSFVPGKNIRDDVPSLRAGECSFGVCPNYKLGRTAAPSDERSGRSLPRRFPVYAREPESARTTSGICHRILNKAGMANQPSEVINLGVDCCGIPGHHVEHKRKCQRPIGSKNSSATEMYSGPAKESSMELARCQGNSRQIKLRSLRSPSGPPSLPSDTESNSLTDKDSASAETFNPECRARRANLVAEKPAQDFAHPLPKPNDLRHDGRSGEWLGCHSEQSSPMGRMGSSPNTVAQQLKRIVGSLQGPSAAGARDRQQNGNDAIGQPNYCGLHQQARRHQIDEITGRDDTDPRILPSEELSPCSTLHPRNIQWRGRQAVEKEVIAGMAPQQEHPLMDIRGVWHTRNRSFRFKTLSGCPDICERRLERYEESVLRRIQQEMEIQPRMDIPTTSVNSTNPTSPTNVGGSVHPYRTQLGQGLLETGTHANEGETTPSDPESSPESGRSSNELCSSRSRVLGVGGLVGSGWSRQLANWSEEEVKLLESSWRPSSLKTYKPIWLRWRKWAQTKGIQVDKPSPQSLAKYLCYLYQVVKLAPRTIAVHKSVVANFGNPVGAHELSSHPLVKQVLKGIFANNPPVKKCISWAIEDLLAFLQSYHFDDNSIFAVSRHTSVLLLLATGRRVHDLTLLSIKDGDFEDKGESIIFWPKFGSKTDSTSHRQSGWLLKRGENNLDIKLDLVHWVKKTVSITRTRRNTSCHNSLFITTRGRVKNASRTVIAGWIKTLLKEAGISATAGSFRAAVATNNWIGNHSNIDEILKRGNWRSKNTFFQHYFREIKPVCNRNPNILSGSFSPVE